MAIRNRRQSQDPNFDLDNYLVEKSNEHFQSEPSKPEKEKKPSSFFRNAGMLAAAVLAGVLWFYDWSPSNVYAAFFGAEEPNVITLESTGGENILVVPPAPSGIIGNNENILVVPPADEISIYDAGNGESIVVIPPSMTDPVIINTEDVAALEQAAMELANSEEIERLTEQSVALALEAALGALEGLEGLEALESLEALEGLEGLEGLELTINQAALEALENLDFSGFEFETESTSSISFDQYSRELSARNINQFDGESIRNLHEAGVPASFLSKLNQAGLLDRLDADEIIDLFEEN